MDIGRALTFFTEEERWIEKTAIGVGVILVSALLSVVLVGVLGFFIVMGYAVRLLQNVRDDVTPVLPEWDQWGDDFVRGFKLFVVEFVWALPIILIFAPIMVLSALAGNTPGSDTQTTLALLLSLCATCLVVVLAIAYALIQPAITVFFAEREQIGDSFQVGEVWRWTRDNIGNVVIVTIVYVVGSFLISMVAGLVGLILCLIGLIVTIPAGQLIIYYFQFHLYGQLARASRPNLPGSTGGLIPPSFPDEPPVDETSSPPSIIE